jgi:membrane protein YdbS with pleckstrin-like domain
MAEEPIAQGKASDGNELPHKPADDREEVYYEGPAMLRAEWSTLLTWGLAGLVIIAIPIGLSAMKQVVPWWAWAAAIVLGLLLIVYPVLMTKSVRFRVTNYRIDKEYGLLSKSIDTLELWHVEDIRFHQNVIDRILRVGDITVISHDDTTPTLTLNGMPNPRPLFESMKQRIIAVKRQRGVIKMDIGG